MNQTIKDNEITKFVKKLSGVAGLSLIIQMIVFSTTPILTRLYDQESFGLQATFVSASTLICLLLHLGYPAAISAEKDRQNAIVILKLSLLITLIFGTFLILCVTSIRYFKYDYPQLIKIDLAYYCILGAALMAVTFTLTQWMIRSDKPLKIIWVTGVSSIVAQVTKISLGIYTIGSVNLIFGHLLGLLFGLIAAVKTSNVFYEIKIWENTSKQYKWKELIAQAYQKRQYPIYYTTQNFLNSIGHQLPIYIFGMFFSLAFAGEYSLAVLVLYTPSRLLGETISLNFQSRTSQLIRDGTKANNFLFKSTILLFIISFPIFSILGLYSREIFIVAFGENWSESGKVAQILTPLIYLQFISQIYTSSSHILNLNKLFFYYEIISTPSKALALIIGILYFNSSYASLYLYTFTGCISYLILLTLIIKKLSHKE